jgi:hypothetical protein
LIPDGERAARPPVSGFRRPDGEHQQKRFDSAIDWMSKVISQPREATGN